MLQRPKKTLNLASLWRFRLEIDAIFAWAVPRPMTETVNKKMHHTNNAVFYDRGEVGTVSLLFPPKGAGVLKQTHSRCQTEAFSSSLNWVLYGDAVKYYILLALLWRARNLVVLYNAYELSNWNRNFSLHQQTFIKRNELVTHFF